MFQYKDYSKYGFRRGTVRKVFKPDMEVPSVDPTWIKSIKPGKCDNSIPTLAQFEANKVDKFLTPNNKLLPGTRASLRASYLEHKSLARELEEQDYEISLR